MQVSHNLDRANIYLSASKSNGLNVSLHIVSLHFCMGYICLFQWDLAGLVSILRTYKHPKEVPKTLIFCQTKDAVCKVYKLLSKADCTGKLVSMFHASLTQATKSHMQHSFQSSSSGLRCLAATVAFGMVGPLIVYYNSLVATPFIFLFQGIDIPDVELVIVHGVPDTMAQLYQVQCTTSFGSMNIHTVAAFFFSFVDVQAEMALSPELIYSMVSNINTKTLLWSSIA